MCLTRMLPVHSFLALAAEHDVLIMMCTVCKLLSPGNTEAALFSAWRSVALCPLQTHHARVCLSMAPNNPKQSLPQQPRGELCIWHMASQPGCGLSRDRSMTLLGKAPTPKGALLPQRIVSYKYLSVQLHS